MQYKPKSIGALHIALGGLPGHMRIEVDSGIRVRALEAILTEKGLIDPKASVWRRGRRQHLEFISRRYR